VCRVFTGRGYPERPSLARVRAMSQSRLAHLAAMTVRVLHTTLVINNSDRTAEITTVLCNFGGWEKLKPSK
jgi:hypothetical protein